MTSVLWSRLYEDPLCGACLGVRHGGYPTDGDESARAGAARRALKPRCVVGGVAGRGRCTTTNGGGELSSGHASCRRRRTTRDGESGEARLAEVEGRGRCKITAAAASVAGGNQACLSSGLTKRIAVHCCCYTGRQKDQSLLGHEMSQEHFLEIHLDRNFRWSLGRQARWHFVLASPPTMNEM